MNIKKKKKKLENLSSYEETYEMFLSLFDKKSRKTIKGIDKVVSMIGDNVSKKSNWIFLGDEFLHVTNIQNEHDYEFKTQDTYRVVRKDKGYIPYDDGKFNNYFKMLSVEEKNFCNKYKKDLQVLHYLLEEKQRIITDFYSSVQNDDIMNMASDLGYVLDSRDYEQGKIYKKKFTF